MPTRSRRSAHAWPAPVTPSRRARLSSAPSGASSAWPARRARGACRSRWCSGWPTPPTPFASPLMPGGFLTAGVGLRPRRVRHAGVRRGPPVPGRRARARAVGLAGDGDRRRASSWRCASTTATRATTPLALAKAPFELPQRLHHVMFETNDRDDVGAAFDRVWAHRPGDHQRARPPRQRRHVQLLRGQPGRLPGRGRPRRPHDHRRRGTTTAATTASAPGATSRCRSGERRARRSTPTSPSSATARSATRWPSCSPSSAAPSSCSSGGPQPYPLPRAVHFDHEVGRILQSCGIGAELRAISEPADIYEWRNGAGTTLLRFGRTGDGPSGWPASSMFNQPALEALLDRRAASCRASTCVAGSRSPASSSSTTRVVVTARGRHRGAGPVRRRLRRRQQHRARRWPASPVHDLGFFFDWLIVDVVLDEPRVFDPLNLQVCDPARPTTAVSGGPGRRRWEFMRLPHETLDELNDEAAGVGAARAVGRPPGQRPPRAPRRLHVQRPLRRAVARRTGAPRRRRRPPDAAVRRPGHVRRASATPPTSPGSSTSSWPGTPPDALLDTYQQERLPSARQAIEFSMELGNVICVPDPAEAAARDEAMAADRRPRTDRRPRPARSSTAASSTPPRPTPGTLFVQGTVGGQAVRRRPRRRMAARHLDADSGAIDDDLRTWFDSIGGEVVARRRAGDRVHARWFAEHDTTLGAATPRLPPLRHGERAGRRRNCCSPTFASTSANPDPALTGGAHR